MKRKNKTTEQELLSAIKSLAKSKDVRGTIQLIPPPEAHQITRSFAFKLNVGNYQSADFFCSESGYAKPGEEEKVSKALYDFCRTEVAKSVKSFKEGQEKNETKTKKSRGFGERDENGNI